MKPLKFSLLIWLCVFNLIACASVSYPSLESETPISFTDTVYGYSIGSQDHHFREEIWMYTLWGIPQIPLGTREGIASDQILAFVVKKHVRANQGVIRLKISHSRNGFTWLATIFSLGLLTPTAVTLEGDVVHLRSL